MKSVLSFQSQVAGARVGNSVAAFAMERLGVRVLQMPTVLFGRRPDRGAAGGGPVAPETLASMLDALEADGALAEVDTVLSGYFALPEQAEVILDAVARVKAANPKARFVCDPVMGDDGRTFVKPEIVDAIRVHLAPAADLLTPNLFEAELLLGKKLETLEDANQGVKRLAPAVLLTSAPLLGRAAALFVSANGSWLVDTARIGGAHRGVGDLFAALFVARRVLGQSVVVSLEASAGAVHDVLVQSLLVGDGHLALVAAQERLEHPDTWPKARPFGDR